MSRNYWIAAGVIVLVTLAVALIPGVRGFIETRLLVWLAGVAS